MQHFSLPALRQNHSMENLKCVAEHNVSAFSAIEPTTGLKGGKTTEKLSRTLNIWLRMFSCWYCDVFSVSYVMRTAALLPDSVVADLVLRTPLSRSTEIKTIQIHQPKEATTARKHSSGNGAARGSACTPCFGTQNCRRILSAYTLCPCIVYSMETHWNCRYCSHCYAISLSIVDRMPCNMYIRSFIHSFVSILVNRFHLVDLPWIVAIRTNRQVDHRNFLNAIQTMLIFEPSWFRFNAHLMCQLCVSVISTSRHFILRYDGDCYYYVK